MSKYHVTQMVPNTVYYANTEAAREEAIRHMTSAAVACAVANKCTEHKGAFATEFRASFYILTPDEFYEAVREEARRYAIGAPAPVDVWVK